MSVSDRIVPWKVIALAASLMAWMAMLSVSALAAEITPFVGDYVGSANVVDTDGSSTPRDMRYRSMRVKRGSTSVGELSPINRTGV